MLFASNLFAASVPVVIFAPLIVVVLLFTAVATPEGITNPLSLLSEEILAPLAIKLESFDNCDTAVGILFCTAEAALEIARSVAVSVLFAVAPFATFKSVLTELAFCTEIFPTTFNVVPSQVTLFPLRFPTLK